MATFPGQPVETRPRRGGDAAAGSCITPPMMPDLAIDIAGLTKTYGKGPKAKQALK